MVNASCMKIINKMAEDDPCWKAYNEKQKLTHTSDGFERQQIQQQIEIFDKICQDRSSNLSNHQRR